MQSKSSNQEHATPAVKEDRPLVSVVMVAYCQERIVMEAIQSCFDQTYEPLEIIISDDCSTDGTWEVIKSMAAKYEGPHKIVTNRNSKNLGIAGNVNKVLQMASGTLILAHAGDDISMPERAERSVIAWLKDPINIKAISSASQTMTREGEVIGKLSAFDSPGHAAEPNAMQVMKNRAYCLGAAAMWHRDLIDYFGEIPQGSHVEDEPLLLRATLIGRACYLDEPLVKHRVGGVSNPTATAIIDEYFEYRSDSCKNRIGTLSAMMTDLSRFKLYDVRHLLRLGRRRLDLLKFENEIISLSLLERRNRIKIAVWKAITTGQIGYIVKSLIYAFPEMYLSYRRMRYR